MAVLQSKSRTRSADRVRRTRHVAMAGVRGGIRMTKREFYIPLLRAFRGLPTPKRTNHERHEIHEQNTGVEANPDFRGALACFRDFRDPGLCLSGLSSFSCSSDHKAMALPFSWPFRGSSSYVSCLSQFQSILLHLSCIPCLSWFRSVSHRLTCISWFPNPRQRTCDWACWSTSGASLRPQLGGLFYES